MILRDEAEQPDDSGWVGRAAGGLRLAGHRAAGGQGAGGLRVAVQAGAGRLRHHGQHAVCRGRGGPGRLSGRQRGASHGGRAGHKTGQSFIHQSIHIYQLNMFRFIWQE